MTNYERVYKFLNQLEISFEVVEHPPVFTAVEAREYTRGMEGFKCLFLCDGKKKKYFLIIMLESKRLSMKALGEIINVKGIKFASPEKLMEKLSLTPGSVSIFGLLNNQEKDVKVYLDKEIQEMEEVSFHPNENTKTVYFSKDNMEKYFNAIGSEYEYIIL